MEKQLKQYEVLKWASLFLRKYNREEKVAELLLQDYLKLSRASFLANMRMEIEPGIVDTYQQAIRQHALTGIPLQHMTGEAAFYGRSFHVSKEVLIPRMETEELVYHTIQEVKEMADSSLTIVDVGTGSGVIAITLALELPHAKVYATDISTKALTIAKKNAAAWKAPVTFLEGDFLQPCLKRQIQADIIVSNPPYISKEEKSSLSDTVKNFDPSLALFAEKQGLQAYETMVHEIGMLSKRPQKVLFEIGHTQGAHVTALIQKQFPDAAVSVIHDMNQHERIVMVRL